MDFSQYLVEGVLRKGIAEGDDKIDCLIEALRSFPDADTTSKESRVIAVARSVMSLMDPREAGLLLAIAIERIMTLEDFEKTVPRATQKDEKS